MANAVLVLGKSGSGKTTGIRNLDPKNTYVISVINKDLPLKGWKNNYFPTDKDRQGNRKVIFGKDFSLDEIKTKPKIFLEASDNIKTTLRTISKSLPNIKTIIIDDSQYIMGYEVMARALQKGYEKFNEMALNFFSIIPTAQSLRDDLTVVFLHHTDETDPTNRRAKTAGRMIDNTITLEGLFNVVLYAESRIKNLKPDYFYVTNTDGNTTAKSPMEMFPELEIPNDLRLVIEAINAYNN